jgi:hypothetical protein
MLALPNGAALTAPSLRAMRPWPGRNGIQVRFDANRADAWAATAVRNAEGLVQVQVQDVAANLPGEQGQPWHSCWRRRYTLATMVMNHLANFADAFLEHAVGRWGNHQQARALFIARRPWRLKRCRLTLPLLLAASGIFHAHADHAWRWRGWCRWADCRIRQMSR